MTSSKVLTFLGIISFALLAPFATHAAVDERAAEIQRITAAIEALKRQLADLQGSSTVPGAFISVVGTSILDSYATISVHYGGLPASHVSLLDSKNANVWGERLSKGGGILNMKVPAGAAAGGTYRVQAYAPFDDTVVYATSAPFSLTAPEIRFSISSSAQKKVSMVVGQRATDLGIAINLLYVREDKNGRPEAGFQVISEGYDPAGAVYVARKGQVLGGFADPEAPHGSVSVKVTALSVEKGTATISITSKPKG